MLDGYCWTLRLMSRAAASPSPLLTCMFSMFSTHCSSPIVVLRRLDAVVGEHFEPMSPLLLLISARHLRHTPTA